MWHREVGCGVGMWGVEERRVEEARALQEKMEREKKALQASSEKQATNLNKLKIMLTKRK